MMLCQSGRSVCTISLMSKVHLMPTLSAAWKANEKFLLLSWLVSSWKGMWAGRYMCKTAQKAKPSFQLLLKFMMLMF